jgi:CDK-activating kinase assembly factor MAT1
MVEKDTSWRRRVTKVFNKVESDFDTLLEYNNYLEEVEDISKWDNSGSSLKQKISKPPACPPQY